MIREFKLIRYRAETLPASLRVPVNVRIEPWLPQNDLLGHPNVRLFVAHAGTNGLGEALFHGVPMLLLPMLLAQTLIAKRIETLGYGAAFIVRNTNLKVTKCFYVL